MARLKSSSLIEVMVSLLLLSIISTISIMIYLNLSKGIHSKALPIYDQMITTTWQKLDQVKNKTEFDVSIQEIAKNSDERLTLSMSPYDQIEHLYRVQILIQDSLNRVDKTANKLYYLQD